MQCIVVKINGDSELSHELNYVLKLWFCNIYVSYSIYFFMDITHTQAMQLIVNYIQVTFYYNSSISKMFSTDISKSAKYKLRIDALRRAT